MKNKYIDLIKNIGVFAFSNIAVKLVAFVVLPLYTYFLQESEYAIIDLVNSTTQLIMPIFTLCMADALLRFGLSKDSKKESVLTNALFIVVVGFAVLPLFIFVFQQFIQLDGYQYIFYIIYILMVLNNVLSAFCKAIDKVKQMALISMCTSIGIVLLNVVFVAFLQLGIKGYFLATIIGYLLGALAYWFICGIYKYFMPKQFDKKLLKEMVIYAFPLIPNALFWWINSNLDKYVLTAMTSLTIVGLYSVANKIPSIVATVTSIFTQAWNISTFQTFEEKGAKEYYDNVFKIFDMIMIVCAAGIILCSRFVAGLLFSKGFYEAWVLIPVLTMGAYYNAKNSFLGSFFTASKRTKYIFYTTGAGAIINAVLNIVLVYFVGMQGAAIATCTSYIVVYIVRMIKVREIVPIYWNIRKDILIFAFLVIESGLMISNKMVGFIISLIFVVILCLYWIKELIKIKKIRH